MYVRCTAVLIPIIYILASSRDIDDLTRAELVQAIIDDLASLAKGLNASKQYRLTAKGTYIVGSRAHIHNI